MKITIVLSMFFLSVLFVGCSSSVFLYTKSAPVIVEQEDYFQYLNPRFLDKTIDNLEYPQELMSYLNKRDKIVIAAMDRIVNRNNDLQIVVERAIVKKLISQGYNVYDRNIELLLRGYSEAGGNLLDYLTPDSIKHYKLNLFPSADILFSYRVLEFGMIKTNQPNSDNVKRIGRAAIEIRLVEAKTLRDLYTSIIISKYEDIISTSIDKVIQDFHYGSTMDAIPYVLINHGIINNSSTTQNISSNEQGKIFKRNNPMILGFKPANTETNWFIQDKKSKLKVFEFTVKRGGSTKEIIWDCKDQMGAIVPVGQYELLDDNHEVVLNFELQD